MKELLSSVHRELSEKHSVAFGLASLPTKLEFTAPAADSSFVFEFTSPDARSNFETTFEDAKRKLGERGKTAFTSGKFVMVIARPGKVLENKLNPQSVGKVL